jgi:hypothetical protein
VPRVEPSEFESLNLDAFRFVEGFELHDVWRVELPGSGPRTIAGLRGLLTPERRRSVNPVVRGLFSLRSALGRLFRLDPEGAWTTLEEKPSEAVYEVINATVHALLVVALVESGTGYRFFWSTYLKPVGRITAIYMALIDPFRRAIVYPGLENWLVRTLAADRREAR